MCEQQRCRNAPDQGSSRANDGKCLHIFEKESPKKNVNPPKAGNMPKGPEIAQNPENFAISMGKHPLDEKPYSTRS